MSEGDCRKFMRVKKFIIFGFLILAGVVRAQENSGPVNYIDSISYVQKLDSLKQAYNLVSNVPEKYELALYTALSYYPELKTTQIRIKTGNIKTTLSVRPTIWSALFKARNNREYILRINKDDNFGNIMLEDVHFQATIGLFGHELAHLVDYSNVGAGGILKRAYWYLSENNRSAYEHQIDMMTIDRGLGWQLYEWSYFVQNSNKATKEYKKLKARRYLRPKQIMSTLSQDQTTL